MSCEFSIRGLADFPDFDQKDFLGEGGLALGVYRKY